MTRGDGAGGARREIRAGLRAAVRPAAFSFFLLLLNIRARLVTIEMEG